jgi:hypothetical protein
LILSQPLVWALLATAGLAAGAAYITREVRGGGM